MKHLSFIQGETRRKNLLNLVTNKEANNDRLTHAYWHWLTDVHLEGYAPAFMLLLGDYEILCN